MLINLTSPSGGVAEVIHKCLAKDPEDRFASAAEMQRALIPAIRHAGSTQ